ncbi:MAG: DUF5916 domain-containing protein [Vicinamibacterales bacterium]
MRLISSLLVLLALSVPSAAQTTDPPIEGPPPPELPEMIARDAQGRITMRALRTPSPLNFDGVLDEPFYRDVKPVGDFIQQEPAEGAPATEKTDVWVFFDRDNLYVSARMYDSQPDKRVATEMRRDANNLFNNDHFGVSFDGFYDRRNGYGFVVNVAGALLDWSTTNEQPNNSWNGVWDAKTSTFSDGWAVEIRFPFRSFRYREGGTIWGMNFRRRVIYKNELSYLAPVLAAWGRPAMSRMSVAATVVGLQTPPIGKNIDVKPYALGSLASDTTARPPISNQGDGAIGLDVKWGVRQTLVADFTVNTDFAQVEDDQQVVNLTRFSVQFPEKRDFFLEGADTFNFANGSSGTGRTRGWRRFTRERPEHQHGAGAVLQPPHRPQQRTRSADSCGRPPARTEWTVALRRVEHPDRCVGGCELAVDELHRGPRQPRLPAPQPHRRHPHAARPDREHALRRHRLGQPRVRRRHAHQPDERHERPRVLREDRLARPHRRRGELPRTLRLESRQVRDSG